MSCTVCMMNCNSTIHAICSLALVTYKYSELQMSFVIQMLNNKANCKTHFFFIVMVKLSVLK